MTSKKRVHLNHDLTVARLAYLLGLPDTHVIKHLFYDMKVMRTLNQVVEADTAKQLARELGYDVDDSPVDQTLSFSPQPLPAAKKDKQNYYQILQVDPAADIEIIQLAYDHWVRKFGSENHPDFDLTKLRKLHEIWDTLSDSNQRLAYDSSLGLF